ncbi:MAG: Signal recognition particle core component [Bathelium mastoideum]|nr:MAG: Signal recognition particle core component [Bathelium mastoideum]
MATTELTSLLRRATIDDHEEVLSAANNALKKSPKDVDAQHAKVVSLLKLDRYNDALRALDHGGPELRERAQLEHAYAFYKAGNLKDARRIVGKGSTTRGLKHVEAQIAYRAEAFERAANLYRELASGSSKAEGEENDLRINSRATDAQLEWSGKGDLVSRKKPGREDMVAFETAYNMACACIARGELAQSEVLLKRAKDLCNAIEDMPEDEKRGEILSITVQQNYALSLQGKTGEVAQLRKELNVSDITDRSLKAIAQVNNLAAGESLANPYLAQRIFQESRQQLSRDKPFAFQSSILDEDAYVVDLLSLKQDGVARSTSKAIAAAPAPTISGSIHSLAVLHAAAKAKSETGKAGIKVLLPLLQKRPNDIGLLLTIIQLYVSTNNPGSAINLLESFFKRLEDPATSADQDVRFAPGLVATLVSLYSLQGRKSHIRRELVKAASYWRRKSKENASVSLPKDLLRAAGTALIESPNGEDLSLAAEIFKDLHNLDSSDPSAIAGLIAASVSTDGKPQNSEISDDMLSALTPVPQLIASVDVDALEAKGIPRPPATLDTAGAPAAKKRKIDDDQPQKAKKLRKCKIPKNYDPENPPKLDPERWLPMKERSYWKPKKKRGRGGAAQGAMQGGLVVEEKEKGRSPDTRPASGTGSGGGGGGGGGAGKKKKKGKGGKW